MEVVMKKSDGTEQTYSVIIDENNDNAEVILDN